MAKIPEALAIAIEHHRAGRLAAAEQIYRQILAAEPDQPDAWHLLGVIAHQAGNNEVAVEYIGRAIGLSGHEANYHSNLAEAHRGLRRIPEAIACCRRALEIDPGFVDALTNLGCACLDQGNIDEGAACFRRALELAPNLRRGAPQLGQCPECPGQSGRGHRVLPQGAATGAGLRPGPLQSGRRVEGPALPRRGAGLLPPGTRPGAGQRRHAERPSLRAPVPPGCDAGGTCRSPCRVRSPARGALRGSAGACNNVRDGGRRLRLGLVSPNLGRHPVGDFLVRALEGLAPHGLEAVCYSDLLVKDDLTRRIQAAATQWRDVIGLNDQQLAQQIRADRIDILFDLAGHTAGNRLLVFARKPAPIQISWAGYPGTTG